MAYRILIVDDEKMMIELLTDYLQDCGYEILWAMGAEEAVACLQKRPDLILLDINMPGTDGLELCRSIRDHIVCPILFLTARITEQDKINGLQYRGDDYITKPFSLTELSARIAAHLTVEQVMDDGSTGRGEGGGCRVRAGNPIRMESPAGFMILTRR